MDSPLELLKIVRHRCIPLPIKYGREFRETFGFLQNHQFSSRESLAKFQWQQLTALLHYAYEHVPYYRRVFNEVGLKPGDVQAPSDFRRIPVLLKEDVVQHGEDLKSDEFARFNPVPATTSATTRDGMTMYRSAHLENYRKSIVWRHYHNIGYRFRERRAQLTVPLKFTKNMYEMPIDHNENMLLIDSRSIMLENCPRIHERLRTFRPKMLFCQPANAAILIEYFLERNLSPFQIPIVYTLGEKIYPEYRTLITTFFDCRIVDYYANRENTVAATELLDGNMYINSEYCYVEFLDADGNESHGAPGDIITTSLQNYAFPLIRYHTEDFGRSCGFPEGAVRNYETMEIIGGRGKDLLLTRDGLIAPQISPVIMRVCPCKYKRIQLEQRSLEEVLIRVVPTETFDPQRDPAIIAAAYSETFANQFHVEVQLVEKIDSTGSGKYRYVISEPAMDYLRRRLPPR